METATTNGLGSYMAVANLTVVGALVLVFVFTVFWTLTRGLPRVIALLSAVFERHEVALSDSRADFLGALDKQTAARLSAAQGGHEAAGKVAKSLEDLSQAVTALHNDVKEALRVFQ